MTMNQAMTRYPVSTMKTMTLLAIFGLMLVSGCSPRKTEGYFLIVDLDNTENVKQYSVFNPYLDSLEECQATASTAIAQILSSRPNVVPKDSKVTGWRCSLLPPERGG